MSPPNDDDLTPDPITDESAASPSYDDMDLELITEPTWWDPKRANATLWKGLILGGLIGVIFLLILAFKDRTAAGFFWALFFVGIEAVLGWIGLKWLKSQTHQESALFDAQLKRLNPDRDPDIDDRAHKLLESSIETIDSAYQTVSNAIIVFGMVGSAAFLLLSMPEGTTSESFDLEKMLHLAPKAFSATGFAIWCGLAIGIAGMFLRIKYRQSGIAHIHHTLEGVDAGAADSAVQLKKLAAGVERAVDVLGSVKQSGMPQHMATLNEVLPAMVQTQQALLNEFKQLNSSLWGETGALDVLVSRLEIVAGALEVVNTTGSAAELGTIAGHLPELAQSQKTSAEALKGLRQAMDTKAKGLLEAHIADLSQVTGDQVEKMFEKVRASADQHIDAPLQQFRGKFESIITEAYETAFKTAREQMLLDLKGANQQWEETTQSLELIESRFREINQGLVGLHQTMKEGAATVEVRAQAYAKAADQVTKEADELATSLAKLEDSGNHANLQAVVSMLTSTAEALSVAAQRLHVSQEQVAQTESKFEAARGFLAEVDRPRSRTPRD